MPGKAPALLVALLRGINVGGNKKVPMAELRALALEAGCVWAETYIQSGNLMVGSRLAPGALEAKLEAAIARHFGFLSEVVVRTAAQWEKYAAGSPFPDAEAERPNLVHLCLAKHPLKPGVEEALRPYAQAGERVVALKDGLWIDHKAGAGRSKLTPAVLDRAAGSTVTARNWRTVVQLAEMARAAGKG